MNAPGTPTMMYLPEVGNDTTSSGEFSTSLPAFGIESPTDTIVVIELSWGYSLLIRVMTEMAD